MTVLDEISDAEILAAWEIAADAGARDVAHAGEQLAQAPPAQPVARVLPR